MRDFAKPTRRGIIGGVVVATCIGAGVQPAFGGADGVSPDLLALIAESERLWGLSAAHNREVHDPLFHKWHDGGCTDDRVKGMLDTALARETELDNAALAAEASVEQFPARNAADLCAKVEYLIPRGWLDCESARVNLLADARRLAGKGA